MNSLLNRHEYKYNQPYFFRLLNKFGCTDLCIAFSDGEKWSPWFRVEELMEKDPNDIVWKNYTRDEFFELANNRTILDIEVVLDFDETISPIKNKKGIIEYGLSKVKELKSKNFEFEAFYNGSKSIHVHILFPELRDFTRKDRERFRELIINRMGADPSKKSDRSMIALEGVPHWKSGVRKERIDIHE
jgi:hypothetical protein